MSRMQLMGKTAKSVLPKILDNAMIEIVLVVLIVVASILEPKIISVGNLINIGKQVSVVGPIAIGMTFVIINGGIDLSVSGVVGVAGMAAVMAQPLGIPASVVLALIVGVITGLFNGYFINLGIAPFIMTMATNTMLRGVAYTLTGGSPVAGRSTAYRFMGSGSIAGIPFPVIVFAVVIAAAIFILGHTVFGRQVYAVGGNAEAARLSGIRLIKTRMAVYSISGLLAAVSGILLTARMSAADPTLGIGFEIDAIAAAVIGGASLIGGEGKAYKTVVGAIIIVLLSNVLNILNVSPYIQMILKGVIIFATIFGDVMKTKRV